MPEPVSFNDLPRLAKHLRNELEKKKFILPLYAYNGVGKTRLSTEFKNLGKDAEDEDKRYPFNPKLFDEFDTKEEAI